MSITIIDPALFAQLWQAERNVELKDPEGNVLGVFAVEGRGLLPPGVKSPFTRGEIEERRRNNRTGCPSKPFSASWIRSRQAGSLPHDTA